MFELYKYFSDKHYSTLSGTLVYFLLMSIAPFLFLLSLIVGELDIRIITDNQIFSAIAPTLDGLKNTVGKIAIGTELILGATSLYSSTNFFYHLRRIGEIIYGEKRKKGGLRLRLSSLLIVFCVIMLVAVITAFYVFGADVLINFMPKAITELISSAFMVLLAFFVAVLLNKFTCPYKLTFEESVSGSLLTVILWVLFAIGFSVYMQYSDPTKLYGKIASIIVFMLWSYLMINCLIIGIIYNGKFLTYRKRKEIM